MSEVKTHDKMILLAFCPVVQKLKDEGKSLKKIAKSLGLDFKQVQRINAKLDKKVA